MAPALSDTVFQKEGGDEFETPGQVVDRPREEFKTSFLNIGVIPAILQGFRKGTLTEG